MKSLELYIHIPFCVKKCAYRDFLSFSASRQTQQEYLKRLKEEIAFYGQRYQAYQVDTVFIGGGTPSVLEGKDTKELMDTLKKYFQIRPDAEITMECNPGTLDQGRALCYRSTGINRISLGLQSANDRELGLLGRIHTFEDFLQSYQTARNAGFDNINVDLMSALPGQKLSTWKETLLKVTELHPEHISAYSLIVEEGTPFYEAYHQDDALRERGEQPKLLPSEEEERAMYELTKELLEQRGYQRYEISNYARPGYECQHNIGYWMRKNYLGLGLGASSLVEEKRFQNTADLSAYLKGPFSYENLQLLDKRSAMEEYMFLGLRLKAGISRIAFKAAFRVPLETIYGEKLQKLQAEGLLQLQADRVFLTERGIDVSNYILAEFLLEE